MLHLIILSIIMVYHRMDHDTPACSRLQPHPRATDSPLELSSTLDSHFLNRLEVPPLLIVALIVINSYQFRYCYYQQSFQDLYAG